MSAVIEGRQIQQRAKDRVAAIEAAALKHLREVGVRRFSTAVVAEMCGSSIGIIYRYWPDTESLIEAVAPGACRAWEKLADAERLRMFEVREASGHLLTVTSDRDHAETVCEFGGAEPDTIDEREWLRVSS